ncbi:MAG TPA: fatty acid--CoA ligase family protein [Kofleriaceae bacterium]|nr:fatty acid--CoA ligase family protein [Kofleriaceae bacterium]
MSAAIAAATASSGALSDGRCAVRYADLPDHFAALDAWRADHDLAPGEIIALECATTVPGAITLLHLLARGFSVVLLPPAVPGAPGAPPRLCRRRLTVRGHIVNTAGHAAGPANLAPDRPASFLAITELAEPGPPPPPALATGHVFLRTSGSVAAPKLAVHSHAGLLGNAVLSLERTRLAAGDQIAIPVPLSHMFGLGAALVPGVAVSASLRFIEAANLLRFREHERAARPSVAFVTPALLATLVRPDHAGPPRDHYRHIVVAGDKLAPALFEAAERRFRRVLNLYGTTEMGVIAVADADDAAGPRATTVGTPLPGVALRLDAPEAPDASGAPDASEPGAGAIVCRHPHGFTGYLDDRGAAWPGPPPLVDGWYRTRDLGRLHGDRLEVVGREDHSVNRDGRLVVLAEVERAIEALPGVARAVTVLGGDGRRGRRVLAFCAPRDGHALDATHLRGACADVLPAYAVPDHVVIAAALPVLPSGKVDRRRLAADASAIEMSAPPPREGTV